MFHRLAVIVFVLSLLATPSLKAQQGGTTTYAYDDDGRLIAVISPAGEASVYEYDEAGNFKAIKRLTANDLAILAFTPSHGPTGLSVTIYGTGFNQGVSGVSFNGIPAIITSSSLATVVATVPEGATTGPITVNTPRGVITSTKPFVVRGIHIIPDAITVSGRESVQFSVSVSGLPTNNVIWSVNGIAGGNQTFGTISVDGLYTALNLVGENPFAVVIRATSLDDEEFFDEATVTVVPFGLGFQFKSDGLSVRYGVPPNNPPSFVNNTVSVRYGTPVNSPEVFTDDVVSVRYGTPPNNPPAFASGALSVTHGPVLSSFAPASIARGASVLLTIQGVALNGATSLSFFNQANGAPASGITISNINVNSEGTSVTATITVASNATTGTHVVVVTTPLGSTLRNAAGSNLLQIN